MQIAFEDCFDSFAKAVSRPQDARFPLEMYTLQFHRIPVQSLIDGHKTRRMMPESEAPRGS